MPTGFGELKAVLPFDRIKLGTATGVLIEFEVDLGKPVLIDTIAKSDRSGRAVLV